MLSLRSTATRPCGAQRCRSQRLATPRLVARADKSAALKELEDFQKNAANMMKKTMDEAEAAVAAPAAIPRVLAAQVRLLPRWAPPAAALLPHWARHSCRLRVKICMRAHERPHWPRAAPIPPPAWIMRARLERSALTRPPRVCPQVVEESAGAPAAASTSELRELTKDDFHQFIAESQNLVVVDFFTGAAPGTGWGAGNAGPRPASCLPAAWKRPALRACMPCPAGPSRPLTPSPAPHRPLTALATARPMRADWCGPCKMIYPELVKLNVELAGRATIAKFNCNAYNKELGKELAIKVAPTFHLYKGGAKVAEMTGAKVDKLRALIEQHA